MSRVTSMTDIAAELNVSSSRSTTIKTDCYVSGSNQIRSDLKHKPPLELPFRRPNVCVGKLFDVDTVVQCLLIGCDLILILILILIASAVPLVTSRFIDHTL